MSDKKRTIQLIAEIISFGPNHSDLVNKLNTNNINWDSLIKEASKHLILPAIFCKLYSKELLNLIPSDLHKYLSEITVINRNRNKTILKEINNLSHILSENNIDHVFLKGSALLIGDYFLDYAERMIGDIDILIAKNQIEKSNQLLLSAGYRPLKTPISYNYLPQKHLPRLVSEKAIAAVELHSSLLRNESSFEIDTKAILCQKRIKNGINIPSHIHLFKHGILAHLYDDYGAYYKYLSLKSAYDTISILNQEKISPGELHKSYYKNYFQLLNVFFFDFLGKFIDIKQNRASKFYVFRLKHPLIDRIWFIFLFTIKRLILYKNRILLFISNKSYRRTLINRLKLLFSF